MRRKYGKWMLRLVGFMFALAFIILTYRYFDADELVRHMRTLKGELHVLAFMFLVYGASFWLRALAWKTYVGKPFPLSVYMGGLCFSLFINHIAPFKIGDAARIAVLTGRGLPLDESVHSVAVMRLFDMSVLLLFSACGMYAYLHEWPVSGAVALGAAGTAVLFLLIAGSWRPKWFDKHWNMLRRALAGRRGLYIAGAVTGSWVCEAVVVYEMAQLIGVDLSRLEAIWINSITVSGQVFQIAPGGLATYETVMAFAVTRVAPGWGEAYALAVMTHAFKFLFSYIAGVAAVIAFPNEMRHIRSAWRGRGGQ